MRHYNHAKRIACVQRWCRKTLMTSIRRSRDCQRCRSSILDCESGQTSLRECSSILQRIIYARVHQSTQICQGSELQTMDLCISLLQPHKMQTQGKTLGPSWLDLSSRTKSLLPSLETLVGVGLLQPGMHHLGSDCQNPFSSGYANAQGMRTKES